MSHAATASRSPRSARSSAANSPAQGQLVLPVLAALDEAGGQAKTADLYDAVADRVGVPEAVRSQRGLAGKAKEINLFARSVRWAQQRARLEALAEPVGNGEWRLTEKGKAKLTRAEKGVVVTIFTTAKGIALWAHAEDVPALVDDASVALQILSPPYPLQREKQYGNLDERAHIDWLVRLIEAWLPKLTDDGSIVLNLGDVWRKGVPVMSTYQERLIIRLEDDLGLRLAQKLFWHNPAALPAPAEWVNIRRVRVKPAMEMVWWLSPSDDPYADNREVLQEYSASMLERLAAGGESGGERPSGHVMAAGKFGVDNGGSIPSSLIVAANTESNSDYIVRCKAEGLPVHPARFPRDLPTFAIKMLTRVGDLVVDWCSGSGQTARVAEDLGRRWLSLDVIREYVLGHRLRFLQHSLI